MRLPYTIAFGAAAVLVVTPAMAQPEERGPFTGIHVEALVGYDRLSGDNSVSDLDDDGITYGAAIGFDAQFGQIIAGVEGELSDSNSRLRQSDAAVVGDEYRLNADRDIYFGARVGYAIAPTTLIYAKGGYTNLRLKTVYDNGAGLEVADGQSLDGWRVGGGVEQKLNFMGPGGFVKAEYRYSNYENRNFGVLGRRHDVDRHQVVAGIGMRF